MAMLDYTYCFAKVLWHLLKLSLRSVAYDG